MESPKQEKSLKRKLRRYEDVFDKLSGRVEELERIVELLRSREALRSIGEWNRGSYLKLVDFDDVETSKGKAAINVKIIQGPI